MVTMEWYPRMHTVYLAKLYDFMFLMAGDRGLQEIILKF